jgi:hypothetical protein
LGIEKLLIAIKIRWYNNIGRGKILNDDEEIANKFDEVYGGISKAISTGLFPYFLKADDVNAEKDIAKLFVSAATTWNNTFDKRTVQIDEVTKVPKPPVELCGDESIVGALNLLHSKGYTKYEEQLFSESQWGNNFSFSQKKHKTLPNSLANEIFVPSEDEASRQQELNYTKQFAMLIEDCPEGDEVVIAAAEFKLDPPPDPPRPPRLLGSVDRPTCAVLPDPGGWLERNQFLTQEKEYEELFNFHFDYCLKKYFLQDQLPEAKQCRIYSRIVPK